MIKLNKKIYLEKAINNIIQTFKELVKINILDQNKSQYFILNFTNYKKFEEKELDNVIKEFLNHCYVESYNLKKENA